MTAVIKRRARFGVFGQLWFQVLTGTVLGIVVGWLAPHTGVALKPFGDAFIKLIRMIIAPIIFVTVVHGIAGMSDMKSVGRVALKSLVYFEVITILALAVGLVVVDLWRPGVGMNIDASTIDASSISSYVATAHRQSVAAYLMNIIPTTLISALTEPNVLQILFVSVVFGVGLASIGVPAKPVIAVIEGNRHRKMGRQARPAPAGRYRRLAGVTSPTTRCHSRGVIPERRLGASRRRRRFFKQPNTGRRVSVTPDRRSGNHGALYATRNASEAT